MIDVRVDRRAVLRTLVFGTVLVLLLFVLVFGLARVVPPLASVKPWVDIGAEANLPTWWNAAVLLLLACFSTAASFGAASTGERRAWHLIALVAACLSLDEVTSLHERLGGLVLAADVGITTYTWVLPGAALALVGTVVLVRVVGRRLPGDVARALGVAMGVYLAGALLLEAVGGGLRSGGHDAAFTVAILLEESLEMFAPILALGVIAAHLARGGVLRPPRTSDPPLVGDDSRRPVALAGANRADASRRGGEMSRALSS